MLEPPPPQSRASRQAVSTDHSEPKEPLQVRIPVKVKRRFKAHAAMLGIEPNELFVEIWKRYEVALPVEDPDVTRDSK